MSSTTSSVPVICSQCGRDCGSHWHIIGGLNVCDFCLPKLTVTTTCDHCEVVAALRARIAELEGLLTTERDTSLSYRNATTKLLAENEWLRTVAEAARLFTQALAALEGGRE